jgi:hypothetical protein
MLTLTLTRQGAGGKSSGFNSIGEPWGVRSAAWSQASR